jgi:hypothetical protein
MRRLRERMNLLDAIAEVQQPRSRFQLERFVLGQHDTPEMQFVQLLLEAQQLVANIRIAELELRKGQILVDRLRATGDEVDAIDADIKQVGLEQTVLGLIGARRELAILAEMFEQMPQFTRAEIEAAQPDYWNKRMLRQTELQVLAGDVGWAQLDALRQIGRLDDVIAAQRANELEDAPCAISPGS